MRRLLVAAALCLPACAPPPSGPASSGQPAAKADAPNPHTEAVTEAESKAKQFIRDNENDPKSIEWASFGPNDDKGETVRPHGDARVVRVRYRAKNTQNALELKDVLVYEPVDGKAPIMMIPNNKGDVWLSYMKLIAADNGTVTWGRYSQLKKGMSREDVKKVMGAAPTSQLHDTQSWQGDDGDYVTVTYFYYKDGAESAKYKISNGAPKSEGGGDLPD